MTIASGFMQTIDYPIFFLEWFNSSNASYTRKKTETWKAKTSICITRKTQDWHFVLNKICIALLNVNKALNVFAPFNVDIRIICIWVGRLRRETDKSVVLVFFFWCTNQPSIKMLSWFFLYHFTPSLFISYAMRHNTPNLKKAIYFHFTY